MDVDIHIQRVEDELSSRRGVVDVENLRVKRIPENRAVIQARLHFWDGSFLEVSEDVDTGRCFPQYLKYRYQYVKNGDQVFRYDDKPHHREIETFPHHKHIGLDSDNCIVSSLRPSHRAILDEISQYLDSFADD